MSGYDLAVDLGVMQQLLTLSEEQREQVIAFMRRLQREPFLTGDYREADDTGRANEIVVVGDLLLFFWSDHAVKTVRIPKIELIADE